MAHTERPTIAPSLCILREILKILRSRLTRRGRPPLIQTRYRQEAAAIRCTLQLFRVRNNDSSVERARRVSNESQARAPIPRGKAEPGGKVVLSG